LNQSNDELEDFAHIASHDLKEPLRGIRNYANFLMEDHAEALGEEGRRKLATIDRLSKRMHDLLGSLLYYSRVGRSDLAVSEVDLNRLVKDVVDSLAPYLVEHSAEVRIVNPLPTLSCDPVRTAEVFSNLITNAVKYNDRTERLVEIGSKAGEGGQTAVFVRDNGIGIPENHFGTIFGIFKRLHSRDEYGGGTGSGLALSKKIVERHGGKIWLQSVVGKGSEFYFTIGAS
jgi:light-regulated signal transduction histidine kinase (bacteriophytochrome)